MLCETAGQVPRIGLRRLHRVRRPQVRETCAACGFRRSRGARDLSRRPTNPVGRVRGTPGQREFLYGRTRRSHRGHRRSTGGQPGRLPACDPNRDAAPGRNVRRWDEPRPDQRSGGPCRFCCTTPKTAFAGVEYSSPTNRTSHAGPLDFEDRDRQRSSWGGYESALLGDAVPGTASFELPIEKPDAGFQVSGVPAAGAGLHVLELTLPPSRGLVDTRYVAGRAVKDATCGPLPTRAGVVAHLGDRDRRCTPRRRRRRTDHRRMQREVRLARAAPIPTDWRSWRRPFPGSTSANRPFYLWSACKGRRSRIRRTAGARGRISWGPSTPLRTHTILDRSLFQPGETVSMKHVFPRCDFRRVLTA